MQGSGWKIVRNEFRQVERLRGVKCFPGGETQFVGNMMTNTHTQLFNGLWSGTTRVGRYQKKHSPTHTHVTNR